MTDWLLDTDVLSELRRAKPDRNVVAFVAAQPLDALHVSVVTLAEIRYGIAMVPGMTVATRDAGGFDRTGAAVFDPWASP